MAQINTTFGIWDVMYDGMRNVWRNLQKIECIEYRMYRMYKERRKLAIVYYKTIVSLFILMRSHKMSIAIITINKY